MTKSYQVAGMTCERCTGLVRNALQEHPKVKRVQVSYEDATVFMETIDQVRLEDLNLLLADFGNFTLVEPINP